MSGLSIDVVEATTKALVELGPHNFLEIDNVVLQVDDRLEPKLDTAKGAQVSVKDLSLRCDLKRSVYVGELGDFPGAKSFVSIEDGPNMLVVPLDNLENFVEKLPRLYTKSGVMPGERRPAIFMLIVPSSEKLRRSVSAMQGAIIRGGGSGLTVGSKAGFDQIKQILDKGR